MRIDVERMISLWKEDPDNQDSGRILGRILEQMEISIPELSSKIGVTANVVRGWISGQHRPCIQSIRKLRKEMGIEKRYCQITAGKETVSASPKNQEEALT